VLLGACALLVLLIFASSSSERPLGGGWEATLVVLQPPASARKTLLGDVIQFDDCTDARLLSPAGTSGGASTQESRRPGALLVRSPTDAADN
jgi:hypothetical protein